ncbi:type II secretion system F family protein [Candidatus Daviesbacteria bacterium]|nr:type II secretion system F family protein [Candidatus Daviesbacteria bacterium]
MAEFIYRAKDLNGKEYSGDVQSADIRTAVGILRKRGLVVITVKPKFKSAAPFLEAFLNRVSFSELVVTTRQLATMVGSGLVLSEAIDILEEQQTNKTFKKALGEISSDVKGGLTLAQALSRHPKIFPRLYVNLVRSGETSGKLDEVLLRMATGLEKEREFQARVRGAMIYPAVVLTMMGVVIIIMMVFVIPKLVTLYDQSTLELPWPTKILIASSNLFINFWWAFIILVVAAIFGLKRWNKTPEGHLFLSNLILKLPIVGKIVSNVTLTNFNRTFGLLTSAGIPLLDSISIVEDMTENAAFKKVLKEAHGGVEKGLPLSSLLTSTIFPRIVGQMVKVGEETGKIDEIFLKLADYFESESDHLIKNLTVAIEPIILIILGIGVGFLVISIILPIYQLTTSF